MEAILSKMMKLESKMFEDLQTLKRLILSTADPSVFKEVYGRLANDHLELAIIEKQMNLELVKVWGSR